ncbi:MAG: hypothetical protein C5B55_10800, partial [Blastocatellia bacterium]
TKRHSQKPKTQSTTSASELTKLRDEYVAATKEYKNSLEKLLSSYENDVKRIEEKATVSRKLYEEGLIAKKQVDDYEKELSDAKEKVAETQRQMSAADSQIANVLVETQADAELARKLKLARGALIRTTSFIRFNGTSGWSLGDAWKVQTFFSDTFKKPLPIAVFGQGAIHDRWRLDHHNAMDISLHPDSAEGQALLSFLQKNGIPFSAFREAIPGTATGPHIHIGRPSHRY